MPRIQYPRQTYQSAMCRILGARASVIGGDHHEKYCRGIWTLVNPPVACIFATSSTLRPSPGSARAPRDRVHLGKLRPAHIARSLPRKAPTISFLFTRVPSRKRTSPLSSPSSLESQPFEPFRCHAIMLLMLSDKALTLSCPMCAAVSLHLDL